jgi:hypothetical protein
MFRFDPPKPANWDFWRRMPQVDLWQAIVLSMGLEPGKNNSDFVPTDSQEEEYNRRFQLADAHIRRGQLPVLVWPHKLDNGNMEFAVVDLRTFGTFARRIDITIPPEYPFDPVNWDTWGRSDVAEVWQAVAIATHNSPDGVTFKQAKESLGRDFSEMLESALRCLRETLPVWSAKKATIFDVIDDDNQPLEATLTKVRLAQFREWAEGKGYTLPGRFPQVMKGSEPEQPTPTETKPAEVAPTQNPPMIQEPPSENREIGENARETLLTIIAMLAGEEKLKKAGSEARKMERKLILRGIESPKYRMIFNHLKAAKQVLENRTVKPTP